MHIQHRQPIWTFSTSDLEYVLSLAWGGGNGIIRTGGSPYFLPVIDAPPSLSITIDSGYGFVAGKVVVRSTPMIMTFPSGAASYNVYHDSVGLDFLPIADPVPADSFMIATVVVNGSDEATPTDVRAFL
jgi:hypothetical protein